MYRTAKLQSACERLLDEGVHARDAARRLVPVDDALACDAVDDRLCLTELGLCLALVTSINGIADALDLIPHHAAVVTVARPTAQALTMTLHCILMGSHGISTIDESSAGHATRRTRGV